MQGSAPKSKQVLGKLPKREVIDPVYRRTLLRVPNPTPHPELASNQSEIVPEKFTETIAFVISKQDHKKLGFEFVRPGPAFLGNPPSVSVEPQINCIVVAMPPVFFKDDLFARARS